MYKKKEYKEVDLFKMIEMVHIPPVNTYLRKYIDKLGRPKLDEQRKKHEEKLESLKKAWLNPGLEAIDGVFNKYWFKLTQYREGEWRITDMKPPPPSSAFTFGIVPRDTFPHLTSTPVDPDEPQFVQVRSTSFKKELEFKFIRICETSVVGVCHLPPGEPVKPAPVKGTRGEKGRQGKLANSYRVFYQYLRKYPDLVRSFIKLQMTGTPSEPAGIRDSVGVVLKAEKAGEQWDGFTNSKGLLYDLIALAQLPGFTRLLAYQVGSAMEKYKTEIAAYEGRLHKWKEEMFLSSPWYREEDAPLVYPAIHCFELTPFMEGDWGMTAISPWPPDFMPYYEFLSPEVMEHLIDTEQYPVGPEKDYTLENYEAKELDKRLDLRFVRLSPFHVVGVVRENVESFRPLLETEFPSEEWDEETAYRRFFPRLYDDPDFYKQFINNFERDCLPELRSFDEEIEKATGLPSRFHLRV